MKRIAFYGGSFDPVHNGHMAVAYAVTEHFELDRFVFIPAFHAPHKIRLKPTSAYDRFAMLCLVTQNEPRMDVSRIEIELPEKPFSVETLSRLNEMFPDDKLFFVMGADSWMDIRTWREWETVLKLVNHIVVTRPGIQIETSHVSDEIRSRIVDIRSSEAGDAQSDAKHIYLGDLVNVDISATEIRKKVRLRDPSWKRDVPPEVAIYIEKYQIYN